MTALLPQLSRAWSEAHILTDVEQIVQHIIDHHAASHDQDIVFLNDQHHQYKAELHKRLNAQFLEQIMNDLPRYLSVYEPGYQYSEHYAALLYACQQMGFVQSRFSGLYDYPDHIDEIEPLVQHMYHFSQSAAFKRQQSDRRYRIKQHQNKLVEYATAIHQAYAKVLVCRTDLYYREQFYHRITIERVMQDLRQLMKSRHDEKSRFVDDIFTHQLGHVWSIEQGIDRGYHIHMGFYFNASYHQNGWYKAEQIGKRWEEITHGQGYAHNSHQGKAKAAFIKYGTYGLDVVHRNNEKECSNSINAMKYLTKLKTPPQHLRKKPVKANAFATGQWKV